MIYPFTLLSFVSHLSGLAWIACVSLCVIYPVSFPPGVIVCRGICLAPTMSLRDRWTFVLTALSSDLLSLVWSLGVSRLMSSVARHSALGVGVCPNPKSPNPKLPLSVPKTRVVGIYNGGVGQVPL